MKCYFTHNTKYFNFTSTAVLKNLESGSNNLKVILHQNHWIINISNKISRSTSVLKFQKVRNLRKSTSIHYKFQLLKSHQSI